MFIKLFIKIKNMMIDHWILSLCLGSAIALEVFTEFAYFVPNLAKIISYVLVGITGVNLLIAFIFTIVYSLCDDNIRTSQYEDITLFFILASFITFILAGVITMELNMLKG